MSRIFRYLGAPGKAAYAAFTVVEDPDRFELACAMEALKPERDQGARHR